MDPNTIANTAVAARDGLKTLVDFVRGGKQTVSLTRYVNQANVMGRVYIEDSIVQDDIAIPLMGVLNQLYVSWIITALGIDSMCADGRTVRERLELVASEALASDEIDKLVDGFGFNTSKDLPSTEAKVVDVDSDTQRLVCGRLVELDFAMGEVEVTNSDKNTGSTVKTKSVPGGLLKAYMYVQLVPYILQKNVCEGFLNLNFTPSISSRWRAVRAGEISFIKDFIFARDQVEKQKKLLKADTTNTLAEMQWRQQNRIFNWAMKMVGLRPETHNLANSFIVINKTTFDQACRDAHVDFNSQITREKFFLKTFSMGLCVVDPMYGNVKMFFAGVPAVGTYPYAMINKVGARGKDSFDLKEIMNAFASGQAPRF